MRKARWQHLLSLAVFASRAVHVRRRLRYSFEDLGERSVKNIAQPIRVFRLIPNATELETPSDREASLMPNGAVDDVPSLAEIAPAPEISEPLSAELVFWESIKDSTRVADYEAYLKQYSEGKFVDLARIRLEEFAATGAASAIRRTTRSSCRFGSPRESDNPATLQAYLGKYPEGEFKSLAEISPTRARHVALSGHGGLLSKLEFLPLQALPLEAGTRLSPMRLCQKKIMTGHGVQGDKL